MENREPAIKNAQKIVVKIGSSSLTRPDGTLDTQMLDRLVSVLAAKHEEGAQVVLVSSGAVAAGAPALNIERPKLLREKQAAAMIGQSRLMFAYENAFDEFGITIGQVLLTVTDVINRRHYANVQNALSTLLSLGIIPIVNENDAVVTDELRFGDNDRIAALASHLIGADALVLLTDVDGLYSAPPSQPDARLIERVDGPQDVQDFLITDRGSVVGTGGMRSKVAAAELAASGGVGVLLTSAAKVGRLWPARSRERGSRRRASAVRRVASGWRMPRRRRAELLWMTVHAKPLCAIAPPCWRSELLAWPGVLRAVTWWRLPALTEWFSPAGFPGGVQIL